MKHSHAGFKRQPDSALNPVERISEMLFGLFMALTFVGAISAATAGKDEVRTMFFAALGCNLAWGLVDAIMYLVRTATDRGRSLALMHAVQTEPDASAARELIVHRLTERSLLGVMPGLITPAELEAFRMRVAALPHARKRAPVGRKDFLASFLIFVIVVSATFPVVVPFILIEQVELAKHVSRAVALAMLFCGGFALGRYAGFSSWKSGLTMTGLGTLLVVAIKILGG